MLCIQSVWVFLGNVRAMTWESTWEGFCEVMIAETALISMRIVLAGVRLRANNCCVVRNVLVYEVASHCGPVRRTNVRPMGRGYSRVGVKGRKLREQEKWDGASISLCR